MIYKVILVVLIGTFSAALKANNAISIEEVVRISVERHPSVREAQQNLEAARSATQASRYQRFPSLTLGLGQSLTEGGTDRPSTTLRLDQPIYSFGRIPAQIARSEAEADAQQAALNASSLEIAITAASVYVDLLRLDERTKLSIQNLARHRALFDSIQRRSDAQISPESDLLLTASRLAQAETEFDQLSSAEKRARRQLEELLDSPSTFRALTEPAPPSLPASLDELISMAELASPELMRLQAAERISQADLELTTAQALPTIYARYERKFGPLDLFTAREQTSIAIDFSPGAGLSSLYATRSARSKLRATGEAISTLKRSLRDRIIPNWINLLSLKSQLPIAKRYSESAKGVAESFERQFAIGRKSWLDVLNAQREAAQAEQSLAEIRWSIISLSYQLKLEVEPHVLLGTREEHK